MDTSTVTTFTIVVADPDDSEATFRAVSTDDDGTVVEDLTYTIHPELVPAFSRAFLRTVNAAQLLGVETNNLVTSAELAAVEASFPTGEQVDAEDGTRKHITGVIEEAIDAPFGSRF